MLKYRLEGKIPLHGKTQMCLIFMHELVGEIRHQLIHDVRVTMVCLHSRFSSKSTGSSKFDVDVCI